VGVEISVPVHGLSRAARVRGSLQSVVHHPGWAAVQNGSILV